MDEQFLTTYCFNNKLKCVGIKSKDVDISISIVIKKAFSNISFLYQFGSF